jgi:hypothetical protein
MSAVRAECGTPAGIVAHEARGEAPCGFCAHAEQVARLSAEGIPSRLPRPQATILPLEPASASEHARLLAREVAAFDRDHCGWHWRSGSRRAS